LHLASKNGHVEVVQNEVNVFAVDKKQMQAIHYCAATEGHVNVVFALLQHSLPHLIIGGF
jgi:hypothetical protein